MGFFLTIIYIAIIFVRPQEFVPAIQAWPILDVMAVFCISAVFLEGGFSAAKFKRSTLNYLILCFWATIPISHISNGYFGYAVTSMVDFAKVLIVYFLIVFTVDTFRKIRVFLWCIVILSTVLAVQSISMHYTGVGLVGGEALQRGDVMQARGIGVFADPNDLALGMVPILAFLLPYIQKGFMSRFWLMGLVFLIPITTGIIYTRSRGGILGLGAISWYYLYRRVGWVLSMGGLAVLAALLVAIPRMGSIDTGESSARSRIEHWSYGMTLLRENLLFGVGKDMFTEDYPQTAHNSLVLAMSELGLIGAYFYLALFFAAFRETRLLRTDPRGPPFLVPLLDGLVAAMLGWWVCAFFLSHTYKIYAFMLLGLVVATMNSLSSEGVEVNHPWGVRQFLLTVLVLVGAVIFMYIAIRVLWFLSI